MSNKNSKGAMEMSVGTIVTIVLLMSVLVLGLVLIKNIFGSSKRVIDMTGQQLQSQIKKLFSESAKIIIYPTSRSITIKQGGTNAVGLGIKNLGKTTDAGTMFSYLVRPIDNNCKLSSTELEKWINLGGQDSNIPIAMGDMVSTRIFFQIPEGTPLCLARYRVLVNVSSDSGERSYDTTTFSVQVK